MKVIEYIAEVLPDGSLVLPDDIRKELGSQTQVKVTLAVETPSTLTPRRVGKFSKPLEKMPLLANCPTLRQSMMNTSTAHRNERIFLKW